MFGWIKKSAKNTKIAGEKLLGTEQIKESASEIKGMASSILSPKERIQKSKTESFKQAMGRLGVTDQQLIQNYVNFAYVCYISLAFAVVCFLFTLYQLFINHSIISSIPGLAILSFCMANAFKFSFRAFQIKHQKLCSVQEWWNRSEEWIPRIKG